MVILKMVDGIEMFFSKEKMIERVKREGRESLIDKNVIEILDNLDGQPVTTACWNRYVKGEPVYACTGKDGKIYDVKENDCVFGK